MIAGQMDARGRDEGADAREELRGGHAERPRAVREGALHRVLQSAVVEGGEAAGGERGAGAVATEAFETDAIVFVDGSGGVQRITVDTGAQGWRLIVDGLSPHGRARGDGVSGEARVREIGLLLEASAALQEVSDVLDDRAQQPIDVLIGGRVEALEARAGFGIAVGRRDEDAIGDERVEVQSQLKGAAEALYEGDGAAAVSARQADSEEARAPSLEVEAGRG